MRDSLLVFCGAGLGGLLRHGLNQVSLRLALFGFPWMTCFINISGSLAMGLLVGYLAGHGDSRFPQSLRLFLATGVLGGYTTFSTFSLENALLIERGAVGLAVLYSLVSVGLGLGGLFLGLTLTRSLS
ncbi:fluoride efflux transporter CrcB [Beijerinckia indica]|uniref:Fluoride-specific ion channel FluC n=1 Tax=Beijerinckia indica subsp. indica (strain ATCC 9039 / DSM 1715 / NCIMB 8712) TaxID=395963 RepID=FLUC_BEII9|nr:fluoride efflux transporter CrcB [Beijerinckia indica]B2IK19.1 RecName: Full=Fluoride-specific ion channel FluC [Beijerinckia indica subsp. indica ATCC 9039]ACB94951.1 CrcB protein [Beijerinckia indica subsp. indica ATCC 9039]